MTRGERQPSTWLRTFGLATTGYYTTGDFVTSTGLDGRYRYEGGSDVDYLLAFDVGCVVAIGEATLSLTIERPEGSETIVIRLPGVVPGYADLLGMTLRLATTRAPSVWASAWVHKVSRSYPDDIFLGH